MFSGQCIFGFHLWAVGSPGETSRQSRLARDSRGVPFRADARGHEGPRRRPGQRAALAALVVGALALSTGCAASRPQPRAVTAPSPRSTTAVSLPRTVVTPVEAVGIDELFARARRDFEEGRFDAAAHGFDRVVELDPGGSFVKQAEFNAGAAYDAAGKLDVAAARYRSMARRFPGDALARDALVRAVRLFAHREQWQPAGEAADELLGIIDELSAVAQVVAYSGKALSLVESADPDAAEHFINKGRDVVDAARLDAAGAVPRDLAQLYFALGELRRIRAERVRLASVPDDFAGVLERRCQLLLDAQSAYSDSMRAYDAHWSAMAGFRVGELYRTLHEELMRIPRPAAAATPERARLFEGALRLRYSVLLHKGLAMLEHTLTMAERTGERSEWVARAAEGRRALQDALRREEQALGALPYSRAELERAFETLRSRNTRTH